MKEATEDKAFIDYTLSPDDEGFVDYELPEDDEHSSGPEADKEFKRYVAEMAKALAFIVEYMHPKLEALGCEWVEQDVYLLVPPHASGLFRKRLGEGIYAFVDYEVRGTSRVVDTSGSYPIQESMLGFRIELYRNKAKRPLEPVPYPNRLRLDLKAVLREHYGLELYPYYEDDWAFGDEDELRIQLNESFTLLQQYGLPWLEDLTTKNPW